MKNSKVPDRGIVLYDGECRVCIAMANRFRPMLQRRGFQMAPLEIRSDQPASEMALLGKTGEYRGGADAIIFISRFIWWAWPLRVIAAFPGGLRALRWVYRYIARNRHCLSRCTR